MVASDPAVQQQGVAEGADPAADRFSRPRRFRHVIAMPDGREDWSGPGVAQFAGCHALQGLPWFEVRPSSLSQCIEDDVIPCTVGGKEWLEECARLQWPIAFLPNTAFYDGAARWKDAPYFRSPWTFSFLLLNDEDINAAWQLTGPDFRGSIARVRNFLRPSIHDSHFYDGPQRWDVLLYLKSRDFNMDYITRRWPNYTELHYARFAYEELRYKAQRSRFCIIGSSWDTYGIATQEIAAEGCPVLVCDPGALPGNVDTGKNALYLENRPNCHLMGSDPAELESAAREVLSWNRRDVRDSTLSFSDPTLLREQWRQALLGELPHHRVRQSRNAKVYCFAKAQYVPAGDAQWVKEDRLRGAS